MTAKQTAVLELLRKAGKAVELRQLTRQAKCGPGPVEALVLKGLARRVARRVDQFADSTQEEAPPAGPVVLNGDQLGAWATLEPALKQGGFQAFLLHGVTGSGKTEIYLRAIEEVMRQGKEALVMVPEISLTPQTIQRFRGRCGEVAVLHSHLGNAERGGHWRRVAAGHAQVIVGDAAPCSRRRKSSASSSLMRNMKIRSSKKPRRAIMAAMWPSCVPGWRTSRLSSARRRPRWRVGTTPSAANIRC